MHNNRPNISITSSNGRDTNQDTYHCSSRSSIGLHHVTVSEEQYEHLIVMLLVSLSLSLSLSLSHC
jgi:hypothetical protein